MLLIKNPNKGCSILFCFEITGLKIKKIIVKFMLGMFYLDLAVMWGILYNLNGRLC